MREEIKFTLNGKRITIEVDGDRDLLWVLRTDLGLTGTKYGCGEGMCGSCTVLVNNEAIPSCQLSVRDINAAEVITIEGLERNGALHPLQKAFVEHDALQCGFCTSGMIMKAYGLLLEKPNMTKAEIIEVMEDNLCRCGAHVRIVDAIESAVKETKGVVR